MDKRSSKIFAPVLKWIKNVVNFNNIRLHTHALCYKMRRKKNIHSYSKVMQQLWLILVLVSSCTATSPPQTEEPKKPNIVFIVADDLGWDDVGFHGSAQIPTPNIDSLALSGVILNNYYVSPSSLATKSEFMTGKYGSRLGVQHGVFHNKQPFGLPEKEKILPQYLKELGYNTYAIGKWGLGFYKEDLLPWKRGFDTFFGGLTSSSVDYFTHSAYDDNYGLDLRRNEEIVHNETGHYATELYTEEAVEIIQNYDKAEPFFLYVSHQAVHSGNADDPLQVPPCYLNKVKHIKNAKRKLYGGMVAALDESVLNITIALADKGFLKDTIIIFTTDSGGAVGGMELNSGSNYPLRGSKLTVWEGGVRGVAFVNSDLIPDKARVNEEMFHSTDWFPTIIKLAGGDIKTDPALDGFDVWQAIIKTNELSPRFEILHQFDPLQKNQCALRVGDYKLIINQDIGFYGDWYPRPAEVGELRNLTKPTLLPNAQLKCDKNYPHPFLEMHAPPCNPMKKPCLFNIQWDPCEFHNLAEFMPNTLNVLLDRVHVYRTRIAKPVYPKFDPKADPENNEGVWGPWLASPTTHLTGNSSEKLPGNNQTTTGQREGTTVQPGGVNVSATEPPVVTATSVMPNTTEQVKVEPYLGNNSHAVYGTTQSSSTVIPSTTERPEADSYLGNNSHAVYGTSQSSSVYVSTEKPSKEQQLLINNTTDSLQGVNATEKPVNSGTSGVNTFKVTNSIQSGQSEVESSNDTHAVYTQTEAAPVLEVVTAASANESDTTPQPQITSTTPVIIAEIQHKEDNISATQTPVAFEQKTSGSQQVFSFGTTQNPLYVDQTSNGYNQQQTPQQAQMVNLPAGLSSWQYELGNGTAPANSTVIPSVAPEYSTVSLSISTTAKPVSSTVAPESTVVSPTGTLTQTSSDNSKEALDVISDPGDHVRITVKNKNGTRDRTHEYAALLEDSVNAGQDATKFDMNGKLTHIDIHQNETGDNPSASSATISNLNLKKNQTISTSSVTDDKMAYSTTEDVSQNHQEAITFESGPMNAGVKTPPNMGNSGSVQQSTTNATAFNETTGEERPSDANTQQVSQQKAPELASISQPLSPPLSPAVPVAPQVLQAAPDATSQQQPSFTAAAAQNVVPQKVKPAKEIPAVSANPISAGTEAGYQPNVPLPPAMQALPQAASLRPEKNKKVASQKPQGSTDKSLSLGAGSDTATSSESSVGSDTLTAVQSDSKLPALKKPLVLASLNNVADAGEPGKQKLSTDLALVTGSYIGKGEGKKPIAQNFVKEPEYASIEKPEFEKPQNPFKDRPGESATSGSATSAGSETESETVVGSFGEAGSDTKIKGKVGGGKGPKLVPSQLKPVPEVESKEEPVAKAVNQLPSAADLAPKPKLDSFVKGSKPNLGNSLKALSSHAPVGKEFSLATGQHNDLPSAMIAGHRPFQSVVDVVSDSSNQMCGDGGRDCIYRPPAPQVDSSNVNQKPVEPLPSNDTITVGAIQQSESVNRYKAVEASTQQLADNTNGGAQATSNSVGQPKRNQSGGAVGQSKPIDDLLLNRLPPQEKLHKFFGELKVDNKKLFYISGTASEDKDLIYSPSDSTGVGGQNDVRKHNIGFNIMLPSTVVKQLTPSPKFKERSKIENSTKQQHHGHVGETPVVHPKNKSAIKKIFDMIADPARTRKTKVELPPVDDHVLIGKTNIATVTGEETRGEAGDIGATKPLKGTLIESKTPNLISKSVNNTLSSDDSGAKLSSSRNTEAGDLGSIVTLVGKVKVDRLSSKRTKHNLTDDHTAHKKTVKEHMALKHMQHNSSETNAANIDKVKGPSNSIIVSSVIIVLIASFVVVGMAVVAIVAVVARHCRLGKRFEAS